MIIDNWSLIIGWEQHYDEEQVEIVHSWLRRSIGFWKVQKVCKSGHLFLLQSNPPNNEIEIFVKIMTKILYQKNREYVDHVEKKL